MFCVVGIWYGKTRIAAEKTLLERQLTDEFLNALVRSRTTYEAVNYIYGEPVHKRVSNDSVTAWYDVGARNPLFRRYRGRIGFTAVFRNGVAL